MLKRYLDDLLLTYLKEDSPFGDITTRSLNISHVRTEGVIFPRRRAVLFGLEVAERVFELAGAEVRVVEGAEEGRWIEEGRIVMAVEGEAESVLLGERLALNLLSHLSGVATATAELVSLAREVNPRVEIAATRKLTPGLGFLEKMAVVAGGGLSHRFSLSDMILIKDNHINVLGGGPQGVKEAVRRARRWGAFHKVEVEVGSLEEALAALEVGADVIMLDNFTPEEAERAYREIKKRNGEVIVEVSGGIRPENVKSYAKSADIISSGYITHSAPSVDFTMEISAP